MSSKVWIEVAAVIAICAGALVTTAFALWPKPAPQVSDATVNRTHAPMPISVTSAPVRSKLTFWTPTDPPKWMASVSSTGEVFIDWHAVEEGVQSEHPRASAAALMMLSIRDKTYKDVSPHE